MSSDHAQGLLAGVGGRRQSVTHAYATTYATPASYARPGARPVNGLLGRRSRPAHGAVSGQWSPQLLSVHGAAVRSFLWQPTTVAGRVSESLYSTELQGIKTLACACTPQPPCHFFFFLALTSRNGIFTLRHYVETVDFALPCVAGGELLSHSDERERSVPCHVPAFHVRLLFCPISWRIFSSSSSFTVRGVSVHVPDKPLTPVRSSSNKY